MEIEDSLSPSEVMLDVRASDKARLLKELARARPRPSSISIRTRSQKH
jgi:hypothetical protein